VTDLQAEPTSEDAPTLEVVWARAIGGLSDGALSPQHRAWLGLTRPVGLVESTALLAAPNEFVKDVLDTRLRPLLAGALSSAYGREIRVAVTVEPVDAQDALDTLPGPGDEAGGSDHRDPDHRVPDHRIDPRRVDHPNHQHHDHHTGREQPYDAESDGEGDVTPFGGRVAAEPARSTPSTPSRPSSSAPPTASRTPRPSRSPRPRPRPTTRCSSTASPGSARPTCCTRSATTRSTCSPGPGCAT
jgi:chromosomal replication initiator protein